MIIASLLGVGLGAFHVQLPEPVMAPLTLLGGAAVMVFAGSMVIKKIVTIKV